MKRTKSTPMSPLTPYAEPEDVRRKLAEDYRRRATEKRWTPAERAEFLRMAEAWERTLSGE